MKKIYDLDLEKLVAAKKFGELSETERNYVLQFIDNASEYDDLKLIISDTPAFINSEVENIVVPDHIGRNIDQALKDKKQPFYKKIIHYKVPFWQVATAAAIALVFLLFKPTPEPEIKLVKEYLPAKEVIQIQHDTVFIEKPAEPKHLAVSNKKSTMDNSGKEPSGTGAILPNVVLSEDENSFSFSDSMLIAQTQRKGVSINEDSLLYSFTVPAR